MKRIFIILCLITFCNISYADIASTAYVDNALSTKQDKLQMQQRPTTGKHQLVYDANTAEFKYQEQ
ncbi:MAG: hypothetical protein KBS86_02375 [Proteobacteria bacterium]|nr:hypothetical protein [Candidatus Enterousia scatequi]